MNWHFISDRIKPKDLEECFAIESRERELISCFLCEKENVFHTAIIIMNLNPKRVLDVTASLIYDLIKVRKESVYERIKTKRYSRMDDF